MPKDSPKPVALYDSRLEYERRKLGPGRPTKLTPELADRMFDAICNGASLTDMLADQDVGVTAFYRWLHENDEFRKRYEEACYIRARTYGEKLVGLSIKAGSGMVDVRNVLAEAHLLEKSMGHIEGGANSWISRRAHAEDPDQVTQSQLTPEFVITFGRPDKPKDWKVTDDMPELAPADADHAKGTILDAKREREKFVGEE